MEEKVLVKSKQYNAKRGLLCALLALTVIAVLVSAIFIARTASYADDMYYRWSLEDCDPSSMDPEAHSYHCPAHKGTGKCTLVKYPTFSSYAFDYAIKLFLDWEGRLVFIGYLGCLLIAFLVFLWLRSYELTVTDKRIYGRVAWGKRVDLPQDSISALSTVSVLKGIAASTSSGAIKFLLIKNADEIYEIMNNQLIERQQKAQAAAQATIKQEMPASNADELKKYKDLLDSGVITQEEFDAKKKQLLGL